MDFYELKELEFGDKKATAKLSVCPVVNCNCGDMSLEFNNPDLPMEIDLNIFSREITADEDDSPAEDEDDNRLQQKFLNSISEKQWETFLFTRIATVDSFQGGESDIVIISYVRSPKEGGIGFVDDANRINVAHVPKTMVLPEEREADFGRKMKSPLFSEYFQNDNWTLLYFNKFIEAFTKTRAGTPLEPLLGQKKTASPAQYSQSADSQQRLMEFGGPEPPERAG